MAINAPRPGRDKGLICLSSVGGTMGDVRPLIALALALRATGFEILLIGNQAFERPARRAGIEPSEWFTCSQVPQTFWMRTTPGQRWLWGERPRYRDRWMRRELTKHKAERMAALWRRLDGPNAPRIAAAVGSISAWEMIGRFGDHCAKIVSCPMPYQPSKSYTLEPPDLSRVDRLRDRMLRRSTKPDVLRRFCEERFHLVSASPALLPRPEDWLPNMQVTGYLPLHAVDAGWSPPRVLSDFLAGGPPPVYVGFGSYPFFLGARGERLAREIIEGCRRRGVRCILQSPDLPPSLGSEQVLILEGDVPHAWLFSRSAAIVHHGGYGTLHAALTASRPMIIYPFQSDQFLWATRMADLGVGPGFTARLRDVTASRVEQDLELVLSSACRQHAARLSAGIMSDDGAAVQVRAIESIVEHTRRGLRPSQWRM